MRYNSSEGFFIETFNHVEGLEIDKLYLAIDDVLDVIQFGLNSLLFELCSGTIKS